MKTRLNKLVLAFIAAAMSVLAISAAFALNVDQTRNFPRRSTQDYHPIYFRVTVNFNDPNISAGQQFGTIAQNAYVDHIDCNVTTAFNAGTTNVVTFGTTKASANEIVASGITAGTPGMYHLTSAAGLGLQVTTTADTPLFAKYAQTGTAATAGSVTCVIVVINNNDN